MSAHETTVPKDKLLTKMRANREAHHAKYKEATESYRLAAIAALTEQLDHAHAREPFNLSFALPLPRDFTEEYDRAIEFFEWDTDEQVVLDRASFNRYVLDEWEWANQFMASTAAYLSH